MKSTSNDDGIQSEGSNDSFICSKCEFSGNTSELDNHIKSIHEIKYRCDEDFVNDETLMVHNEAEHEQRTSVDPSPCETCGLVLASTQLLQEHMISHDTPSSTNIKCDQCTFIAADVPGGPSPAAHSLQKPWTCTWWSSTMTDGLPPRPQHSSRVTTPFTSSLSQKLSSRDSMSTKSLSTTSCSMP